MDKDDDYGVDWDPYQPGDDPDDECEAEIEDFTLMEDKGAMDLTEQLEEDADSLADEEWLPGKKRKHIQTMDNEEELLEASGMELADEREAHRSWLVLQTQLNTDLTAAKKANKGLTVINQLLILRNFAMLQMKGLGWMAASQHIAAQWHKGSGLYFARQIRVLARHYQHFEQLPDETHGGEPWP
ncbi:hypothetical protein BJV78DRAFT_1289459 [Lactifluus subvellereus]|nr:hypothetical protein BJV78DRAFT_1289459 [Lactifluus subvellereus]